MLHMKSEVIKIITRTAVFKDKSFCVLYMHVPRLQPCQQLCEAALKHIGALSSKLPAVHMFTVMMLMSSAYNLQYLQTLV